MKRLAALLIVLLVPLLLCACGAQGSKGTSKTAPPTQTEDASSNSDLSLENSKEHIMSVQQLANNVCDYITKNSIAYNKEQDFESFQSPEMYHFAAMLHYIEIVEPGTTSVELSVQELEILQMYMTETALPYDYALPMEVELVQDIVNAETARDPENAIRIWKDFTSENSSGSYKVRYYYQSEKDTDFYITIDYSGNMFLSTASKTFKVEFSPVRTIVHSLMTDKPDASKVPDTSERTEYTLLNELARRVASAEANSTSIEISIDELSEIVDFLYNNAPDEAPVSMRFLEPKVGFYYFNRSYLYREFSDCTLGILITCDHRYGDIYLYTSESKSVPLKVFLS